MESLGRYAWGLAMTACLGASTGTAFAQGTSLFSGPSIHETGRIGGMSVDAPAPAPSPEELSMTGRTEKSIVPAAASLEEPRRPAQGLVNQRILEREIDLHFAALDGCRVSVARARQVHPSELAADTLLLRWRIEGDGTITTTDVVATSPTDLQVMDCVKRAMSRWTFSAPRGGTVDVERTFTFRALREPTRPEVPEAIETRPVPEAPAAERPAAQP